MITGLYAGIAAIMLVYLSFRVVGARRRNKVSLGDGGVPELERAMRVQANFVEYTPLLLLLLAIIEMNGLAAAGVHGLGAGVIAARVIHFIGFSSESAPFQFRVGGAALTFLLLLGLGALVIAQSVGVLR
ncbi:MAG: MAPEG family protein [Pseudomonadota bacterium]